MDKLKGVTKGGWHPSDKSSLGLGKKVSLRGDSKGINQIAGWMGKGKEKSDYSAEEHQSAPLSSLKDPDSFGPPPKRGTTDSYSPSSSTASPSAAKGTYTSRGLGAAIPKEQVQERESRLERERREAEEEEEEERRRAAAPKVPYRADTTGLSTAGLPAPPIRRDVESPPAAAVAARPKPSLPPRLPPRGVVVSPPPTYDDAVVARPEAGELNTGAVSRLGQAGVNVSGFEIGRGASAKQVNATAGSRLSEAQGTDSPSAPAGHGGQMNELQARFARMKSNSDAWSQGRQGPSESPNASSPQAVAAGKKPPPPPPPKKKELHGLPSGAAHSPPPVPMGSRPSWTSG